MISYSFLNVIQQETVGSAVLVTKFRHIHFNPCRQHSYLLFATKNLWINGIGSLIWIWYHLINLTYYIGSCLKTNLYCAILYIKTNCCKILFRQIRLCFIWNRYHFNVINNIPSSKWVMDVKWTRASNRILKLSKRNWTVLFL